MTEAGVLVVTARSTLGYITCKPTTDSLGRNRVLHAESVGRSRASYISDIPVLADMA